MHRRQFLQTSALSLMVAGIGAGSSWRARAETGPIKIGVLAPLTGVVAAGGREMVEGTQFWFDQVGNEVAGRKVELIIEDDGSNPDTSLQKARKLVEQANVAFLMGNLLANTGLAVANYVKENGTPYFIPIIAADYLTQRQRIKNVVRVAGYSASAYASAGRLGLQKGLPQDRDHQPGLHLRSRAMRRVLPGVH
jgi:branched-chain amino acid transport system substrate-binding protein